jgi:CBS domain-containing protein
METIVTSIADDLITPERSSGLAGLCVHDVMNAPPCSCGPEASLTSVAHTMAARHIHALIVEGLGEDAPRPWGIVSAMDVARAAAHPASQPSAADAAATEFLTIDPDASLSEAARLMVEHRVGHLVVAESPDTRPVGVISTLDIARAYSTPAAQPSR